MNKFEELFGFKKDQKGFKEGTEETRTSPEGEEARKNALKAHDVNAAAKLEPCEGGVMEKSPENIEDAEKRRNELNEDMQGQD